MRAPGRVVALVAHPDDESWLLGGLLARWRREGAHTTVVCATDGEAGVDRQGRLGEGLRRVRVAELEAACAVLGAELLRLEAPDGALDSFPVEPMLQRLRGPCADAVVVTHGRDGDYGHRDHLAVAGWGAALGAWHVVCPPGRLFPVYRRLRRFGFAGVVDGLTRSELGGEGTWQVALDAVDRARQREALACHASQLRGAPEDFLDRGLLDDLGASVRLERSPP